MLTEILLHLTALWSQLLSSVDNLFHFYWTRVRGYPLFFARGIGSTKGIDRGFDEIAAIATATEVKVPIACGGSYPRDFKFQSPIAHLLPSEVATAHVRVIGDLESARAVVVHLAGTGDQGYSLRTGIALPLFKKHGIASVLLMSPFYALRKANGQKGAAILTVEDIVLQSAAICSEAANLVRWLRRDYPGKLVGITGISYGGSMTVYSSLLCGGDLAVSTLVPCERAPFLDEKAVLRDVLHPTVLEERHLLETILERTAIDDVVAQYEKNRDSKKGTMTYTQISARNDQVVPSRYSNIVAKTMTRFSYHSKIFEISGGHVSAIILHQSKYVEQIAASFDTLEH
ncbi:hypothetical protein BC830DRAFT_1166600 [Chytriomyces sp. MP71]|nr:hypothetical protein BC830DRAFT_1166600 [Chytriomyces sp. MP71]